MNHISVLHHSKLAFQLLLTNSFLYVLVWLLMKISTGFSLAYFFLITVCRCPWISRLAESHKPLQTITPCCHQKAQHILPTSPQVIPGSYILTYSSQEWWHWTRTVYFGRLVHSSVCIVAFLRCIGTGQWRKHMKHTLSSIMEVEVKVRPSTCSAEELWISGCKRNSTS